jgi:DNA-binding HxlR family transcriptional regulator
MESKALLDNQPDATPPVGDSILYACPAEDVLRLISGKWKPQILHLASQGPIRFNGILRRIRGSNKQSLSVALHELEEGRVLDKNIVSQKPLHIEYSLTEKGLAVLAIFRAAALAAKKN